MTIKSTDLISRLAITSRDVAQFDAAGVRIAILSPLQALMLVRHTPHTGITRGRNGQIRSIRAIEQGKLLPWKKCWRTTNGSCALPTFGYDRTSGVVEVIIRERRSAA